MLFRSLFQKGIDGLLLCEGGVSSHMAILARTYGVPAVFGIDKIEASLPHEAEVIIDANKALVILDPDLETKKQYTQHKTETEQRLSKLAAFITKKAVTKDGTVIQIFANIGSVEEAEIAEKEGADGIGLFRTEFLFMSAAEQGLLIDEETQYKAYSSVLEIMKGKPVTIRTLDAGGDKVIPLSAVAESITTVAVSFFPVTLTGVVETSKDMVPAAGESFTVSWSLLEGFTLHP